MLTFPEYILNYACVVRLVITTYPAENRLIKWCHLLSGIYTVGNGSGQGGR